MSLLEYLRISITQYHFTFGRKPKKITLQYFRKDELEKELKQHPHIEDPTIPKQYPEEDKIYHYRLNNIPIDFTTKINCIELE
jgi:hypothetical protein